jgi:hypothetical protein
MSPVIVNLRTRWRELSVPSLDRFTPGESIPVTQWLTEGGVWGVQPPRNSEAEPNSEIRGK